jgi:hypothetical protein
MFHKVLNLQLKEVTSGATNPNEKPAPLLVNPIN